MDYNSVALTRRCLASLVALGRRDLGYFVVDNGGCPDIASLVADFPGVVVIRADRNLGFAGGCNLGIDRALSIGAEYCLLLNPDVVAEHDFVESLVSAMKRDDRIGMACPTQRDDGDGRIAFGGAKINWWSGRPRMIAGRRLRTTDGFCEIPFASGAAMLLRATAIRDVGPMDENYFLYFEDTDYSQSFIRAGWKAIYVPDAEVRHIGSGIIGFRSERYLYYFARNRIRFMRRWGRWYHRLVFTLFNTLVRLPAMVIVFGVLPRRPALAIAYIRGYVDGMFGR